MISHDCIHTLCFCPKLQQLKRCSRWIPVVVAAESKGKIAFFSVFFRIFLTKVPSCHFQFFIKNIRFLEKKKWKMHQFCNFTSNVFVTYFHKKTFMKNRSSFIFLIYFENCKICNNNSGPGNHIFIIKKCVFLLKKRVFSDYWAKKPRSAPGIKTRFTEKKKDVL